MLPSGVQLDHFAAAGAGLAIRPRAGDGERAGCGAAKNGKSAEAARARRMAVLGVADSAAGCFDALDERGVAARGAIDLERDGDSVGSGLPPNTRDDGPGVDRLGRCRAVTAVVVVDPRGRLAWAWSRRGELLTGGSMLLVRARPQADRAERGSGEARVIDPGSCVRLETTHAARLAAEWLSWSAQTGSAPGRVVVLCPERTAGLSPSEFCTRVVSAWPGATVDLVTDDEPIELTLRRPLADEGRGTSAPGGGGAIAALSARRGGPIARSTSGARNRARPCGGCGRGGGAVLADRGRRPCAGRRRSPRHAGRGAQTLQRPDGRGGGHHPDAGGRAGPAAG